MGAKGHGVNLDFLIPFHKVDQLRVIFMQLRFGPPTLDERQTGKLVLSHNLVQFEHEIIFEFAE
jgi:hypothetical protein